MAITILAVAVGLALLAGGVALATRELGRRQRMRLGRRSRSERLMWERLDWVADPVPARPEPGEMPAETRTVVPVATVTRPAVAEAQAPTPEVDPTDLSRRRRLWRDTSAVLFVGVMAILVYSVVATPGPAPEGGVLAATSSPAASPLAEAPGIPSPTPTTTAAPTHGASPTTRPAASPSPTLMSTQRPSPASTPRPTPQPTPRPTIAPSSLPSPTTNPSPIVITPPPAPTPAPAPTPPPTPAT